MSSGNVSRPWQSPYNDVTRGDRQATDADRLAEVDDVRVRVGDRHVGREHLKSELAHGAAGRAPIRWWRSRRTRAPSGCSRAPRRRTRRRPAARRRPRRRRGAGRARSGCSSTSRCGRGTGGRPAAATAARMRAVTACPMTGGRFSNTPRIVESANPSLRRRTSNVSMAFATLQVSRRRNASTSSARSRSMDTPNVRSRVVARLRT